MKRKYEWKTNVHTHTHTHTLRPFINQHD